MLRWCHTECMQISHISRAIWKVRLLRKRHLQYCPPWPEVRGVHTWWVFGPSHGVSTFSNGLLGIRVLALINLPFKSGLGPTGLCRDHSAELEWVCCSWPSLHSTVVIKSNNSFSSQCSFSLSNEIIIAPIPFLKVSQRAHVSFGNKWHRHYHQISAEFCCNFPSCKILCLPLQLS